MLALETHAGAGLYDLSGGAARRTGEGQAGASRLMQAPQAPAALQRLWAAIAEVRRWAGPHAYPGSPLLAALTLRARDRYVGCELRPDDHARLGAALSQVRRSDTPAAQAILADGYDEAPRLHAPRRLVMIDPPFERPDEAVRLADCAARLLQAPGETAVVVWAPLKDLDGFDRLCAGLECVGAGSGLVVELRLRPLTDPLRLNGCALVLLNAPEVSIAAEAVAAWLADRLGEPGAQARLRRFGPSVPPAT